MIWFFLTSGLFLGWSLGAKDAANVFGTAVGSRMVRFKVAALITSLFVILGSVVEGSGTTETLGHLGAVNAMAGSFTVALAAGLTIAWMTHAGLPVATNQAIVGGIIGWNLFTDSPTDLAVLSKIVATWLLTPLLAALCAILIYLLFKRYLTKARIHMLRLDAYTRVGLIIVGAVGSYSLGANNIANVMGVFVPASPFKDIRIFTSITFTGTQQLFLLGALAIAVGIYTYSHRMMRTVGNDIFKLTPIMAFIVVLAHTIVLLLFGSQGLKNALIALGLPTIPLVPVSSSQAIVGAVFGIGIIKGARVVNYKLLGRIASGWVMTPLFAVVLTFIALFFVQNVFEQTVVNHPVAVGHQLDEPAAAPKTQAKMEKKYDQPLHMAADSANPAAPILEESMDAESSGFMQPAVSQPGSHDDLSMPAIPPASTKASSYTLSETPIKTDSSIIIDSTSITNHPIN